MAGQGHFGCGCMSAGDGLTRGRDVKRGVFQRRGTAGLDIQGGFGFYISGRDTVAIALIADIAVMIELLDLVI